MFEALFTHGKEKRVVYYFHFSDIPQKIVDWGRYSRLDGGDWTWFLKRVREGKFVNGEFFEGKG